MHSMIALGLLARYPALRFMFGETQANSARFKPLTEFKRLGLSATNGNDGGMDSFARSLVRQLLFAIHETVRNDYVGAR